jgi:hypothetical protein
MQDSDSILFLARTYQLMSLWLVSKEKFLSSLTTQKNQLNGESVSMFWHTVTSHVCTFIPYHGKITTDSLSKPDLPFTSRIVLQLSHNIRQTWPDISIYHIFTDRFYTSPTLASELSKVRCHLTGTVMNNRRDVPAVMKKPKLKKVKR